MIRHFSDLRFTAFARRSLVFSSERVLLSCLSRWARGSRFFERKIPMHFWLPEL